MNHNQTGPHWPSVAQFGISGCGMILLWSLAGGLLATSLAARVQNATLPVETATLTLALTGVSFVGLLLLPSALLSLLRILQRPVASQPAPAWARLLTLLALGVWIFTILVGYWIPNLVESSWLFLPLLYLLGVALPIGILVWIAGRGLLSGSPQRRWGLFASGLVIGPTVVLILEVGIALTGIVALILYVLQDPQLIDTLNLLAQRLMVAQDNPQVIGRILRPYLNSPQVLLVALTYFSLLAPLVEEALKPLGMWFLARRRLSPGEGFAAGALCGAGFALVESLANASNLASGEWAALALGRAGTDVMHVLSSGVVGWGLAVAWSSRKYLKLAGAYLLAVAIHGGWNALSLLIGLRGLTDAGRLTPAPLFFDRSPLSLALAGLTASLLVGIVAINRHLKRQAAKNIS